MQIVLKLVVEEDIELLDEHMGFGLAGKHKKRLDSQHHQKGIYVVAWENSIPVGHVFVIFSGPNEQEVKKALGELPTMEDLLVVEEKKKFGIGRKLVGKCEEILCNKGFSSLGFGVGVDNNDAIAFYEKLGFRNTSIKPFDVSWVENDKEVSELCLFYSKTLNCS